MACLLALCERDVERLAEDKLVHHLGHCLGRLLGRGEADKAKALGLAGALVGHDAARGDRSVGLEGLAEVIVLHVGGDVLDVQVDALELFHALAVLLVVLHACAAFD